MVDNPKLTPEIIKLLNQQEDLSKISSDELLKELFKRRVEENIATQITYTPSENQVEVKFEVDEKDTEGKIKQGFNITLMDNTLDIKAWCQALISYEQRGNTTPTQQEENNRAEIYNQVLDALEKNNPKLAEIIKSERERQKKAKK